MFTKIDHIGIAVENLELAIAQYQKDFAVSLLLEETLESQKTKLAFLSLPGTTIELLSPLTADSIIGRFLNRFGPGLHHMCYEVPDIDAALEQLAKKGYELIDQKPRAGARNSRIAFIHPRSCGGVLTELCSYR